MFFFNFTLSIRIVLQLLKQKCFRVKSKSRPQKIASFCRRKKMDVGPIAHDDFFIHWYLTWDMSIDVKMAAARNRVNRSWAHVLSIQPIWNKQTKKKTRAQEKRMHLFGNWHLTIATNYARKSTANSTNSNIIIIGNTWTHDLIFFMLMCNMQWIKAIFTKRIFQFAYYYR